jgi:hypothetical protein
VTETLSPLPPWDVTLRDFIRPGLPHLIAVGPGISVFTDASPARIGLRFEVAAAEPAANPSLLEQITISDVMIDGRRQLEIATTAPALFESFYGLAAQVISTVVAGESPAQALNGSVAHWEALIRQTTVLPEERQAGLFGELIFLERLTAAGVEDPVATWVGPDRQAHDFRWGELEFEVKTTSGTARVHTINGLTQLMPSLSCRLFLISIQLTDAGTGGRSLPELVGSVRGGLSPAALADFDRKLGLAGYLDRHAPHYRRRRRLRGDTTLIEVGSGVPRLTPAALTALPDTYAASRIRNAVYDIDVGGLGHADGTSAFHAVIPAPQGSAA